MFRVNALDKKVCIKYVCILIFDGTYFAGRAHCGGYLVTYLGFRGGLSCIERQGNRVAAWI